MPRITPSVLAYCKLTSKKATFYGWLGYMEGRVGNTVKIQGSDDVWVVEEVRARFPAKMVLDKPLDCINVSTL